MSPSSAPSSSLLYAERHAHRVAPGHFRSLAGLLVSSIGMGSYLGECTDEDDALYEEAAFRCLAGGINLLDTAINYRCQRSERALGRALRRAVAGGVTRREEVVLCTKGGYIPFEDEPPASREDYHAYVHRRFVARGLCRADELTGGQHCLAPAYLRDQVETSQANLGVARIDIYYVHNPETQLRSVERSEFLARMRAAFEALESLCDDGRIRVYGTATWDGYRLPPEARESLSLAALVRLAEDVAGPAHRFRVVQLPYNLVMPEAALAATQTRDGTRETLLSAAARLGVAVVASATLLQSRLARSLPSELRAAFPHLRTDAQRALHFVRSTRGIACALVGMREAAHVAENLELVSVAPVPDAARRLLGV